MHKLLISALIIMLLSCTYDNEEELFDDAPCGDVAISLEDDIQPIVTTNCAISGCHISGGQPPDLSSRQQIANRATRIKVRTQNGSMPPPSSGLSLSNQEIKQISCWVDAGANQN